jgi:hypothetical protein
MYKLSQERWDTLIVTGFCYFFGSKISKLIQQLTKIQNLSNKFILLINNRFTIDCIVRYEYNETKNAKQRIEHLKNTIIEQYIA